MARSSVTRMPSLLPLLLLAAFVSLALLQLAAPVHSAAAPPAVVIGVVMPFTGANSQQGLRAKVSTRTRTHKLTGSGSQQQPRAAAAVRDARSPLVIELEWLRCLCRSPPPSSMLIRVFLFSLRRNSSCFTR